MNIKENMNTSNYHALFLSLVFVIISFANSGITIAKGLLYCVFIIVIFIVPIIHSKIQLIYSKVLRSGLILITYNILIIFVNFENQSSVYNGLLYSGLILFVLVLLSANYKLEVLELIIHYMSFFSKLLLLLNIFFSLSLNFIWVSSTSFLFLFLYFIYVDKHTKKITKVIYSIIWLLNAILDESRTFILLFPVFVFLIFSWNKITKFKLRYNIIFIFITSLLFLIPIFYIYLSHSKYALILNQYALEYTDSRFFSGRDSIWSNLLTYYYDHNLFFGGGHHVTPYYVYGHNISSHNTFISILITTGIIGSILFILFARNIWNSYLLYKNNKVIKYSAIFFIVLLLKQSSELSLIGNNVSVSIISWLVIAFGLMYVSALNIEGRQNK
ncbi:O-antigen ligase family protein [Paenibacillus sp. RS8]|uniref:O-antigen ligase family protein n=1 Tax=Paenibacillus sp. RS8 TaxID=3242681 RepID=UPI0035C26AB2